MRTTRLPGVIVVVITLATCAGVEAQVSVPEVVVASFTTTLGLAKGEV
jgi:hypothetical protein